MDKQEQCCQRLSDFAARSQCMSQIICVDDPAVQMSELNQATFSCFASYFVCDPQTGTVTREASQKQLECITDLR